MATLTVRNDLKHNLEIRAMMMHLTEKGLIANSKFEKDGNSSGTWLADVRPCNIVFVGMEIERYAAFRRIPRAFSVHCE